MGPEDAIKALRPLPSIKGEVIADEPDVVRIRSGGAILEIPRRFVSAERRDGSSARELTVAPDALIVVSMVVSVSKGFLADDVFGALSPSLMANNCNCNCNCESSNCNCNCNCNCDCGGSGCAGGIQLREIEGEDVRRFRQPVPEIGAAEIADRRKRK